MRILEPGVGAAEVGDHAAETRIGEHVAPRRRRWLACDRRDHVLATVGAEAADAVEELQVGRRAELNRRCRRRRRGTHDSRCGHARCRRSRCPWRERFFDLIGERTFAIAQNDARDRLQENAVFRRHVLDMAHENAAGALDRMPGRSTNQAENLLV